MVHDYEIYCESEKNDLIRFHVRLMRNFIKLLKKN